MGVAGVPLQLGVLPPANNSHIKYLYFEVSVRDEVEHLLAINVLKYIK